jgi:3-oxoacyl-[acyl-carrier-protein] synthase-3
MKRAGILGLGLWVPDEVRTNDAWPKSFVDAFHANRAARRRNDFTLLEPCSRPYDDLFVRFASEHEDDPFKGATRRRVAPADQPTAIGDAEAARRALADARVDPKQIDLVVSSALVPDRVVPSNGPRIQQLTGCRNAPGIGVESYCSAALAQLDIASSLVESGRARYVLCVQSHQIARANDLTQPFSPMFGDASAAFVVGEAPTHARADRGLVEIVRGGDGSLADAVTFEYAERPDAVWYANAQGPVRPGSHDLRGAREMGKNLLAYAIDTIADLCKKSAFPIDSAAAVCTMQPLVWFQSAVAAGLGISPERVPSTYAEYAHIGGAGVVANLLEARRRGLLKEGAPVVLFAHGAGMTRYAALLRWCAAS